MKAQSRNCRASIGIFLLLISIGPWMEAEQGELSFEKDIAAIQVEREQTDRLMKAAKLHVLPFTPEMAAFMKNYRRNADVVETSMLGFLSDAKESPDAFMKRALEKDSWKKPMDTPLSFVIFYKPRTTRDWFRLNYARLHNRGLDVEVDQLCPADAPESKEATIAVIEIPLGAMSPGSFHYTTWINTGNYTKALSDHPKGWEYADVTHLGFGPTGASGCTIVDPKINEVPRREAPPVRKTEFLTEAQLDDALERLHYAKFPMSLTKVYDLMGFTEEQRKHFHGSAYGEGVASIFYQLTNAGSVHILEMRGQKGDLDFKGDVASALIYYQDGDRRYMLYDSRLNVCK